MTGEVTPTTVALVISCAVIFVTLPGFADFLAHVSRYRRHIRQYPATKSMRGLIWKRTR
jgi:hypothetical protein